VLAFTEGAVLLLDGATGATQHRGRVSGQLGALDGGAELVTVDEHAVRVWEVASLRADLPCVPRGCDQGFVRVLWSPDGTRLLTGRALCDGREGRPLRDVPLDTGLYLEGGPPIGGTALGDRLLVEQHSFGSAGLWDPRDGRRLPSPPRVDRPFLHARYWFAPDAEHHVVASPRSKHPAELRRTRDNALLATLDAGLTNVIWSPDNQRFTTHAAEIRGYHLDGATLVDAAPLTPAPSAARHVASYRDGLRWLTARDPSTPSYGLTEDDPLVPDPTGHRWASRFAHYALEP
jgi:hypothetical protein